ncbi:trypsin-like peptidase domain-containing protein [Corallococcus terminator]
MKAGVMKWGPLVVALLASSGASADLARRRDAVVEVVQKVSPAVVYIGTEQEVESRFRRRSPLEEFFGGQGGEQGRQKIEGLGSGVIIDPTGIIVTNDHVIRGASAIHVVLADGRSYDAEVIGSDAGNDLAVLKVTAKEALPIARLGTSADLMIGETVVAIGSPFGLSKTVTAGVVSAVGRTFRADNRVYNDFVQTDAAINPGNSGGPLLNVDGEIIGINTAIFGGGAQGIGFAIPADKVRRIVDELTRFGKVRPAWVGLDAVDLTPRAARQLGWDRSYGALVTAVEAGSPADQAGVKRGDIVAELGGSRIQDAEDFDTRVRGYPARSAFPLALFREGATRTVQLTPSEFPPRMVESLAWDRLGLKVKEARGVLALTGVRAGSAAAEVGLEPGDIILRVNNQPVTSADGFKEALVTARRGRSVLLLVRRGRYGYHITLPFEQDRGQSL